MLNRIICTTLLLFLFALPTTVFSHAYLEDSIPKNGAIIKESQLEIELLFSSRIEPLSTFELLNEQEESVLINQYIVEQDKITGVLEEPLPNGLYIVNWRIIAADGHTSDGQFSFEVELSEEDITGGPVNKSQDQESKEEEEKSEQELNEESIIEEETNEEAAGVDETTQAKASPLASLWLTGLIILIGIFYFVWRKRRKV